MGFKLFMGSVLLFIYVICAPLISFAQETIIYKDTPINVEYVTFKTFVRRRCWHPGIK